jgi:hypothetical protein
MGIGLGCSSHGPVTFWIESFDSRDECHTTVDLIGGNVDGNWARLFGLWTGDW